MASLEITVDLAELPEILSSMREWLDRHKTTLTHFRSTTDDDRIVTIRVGFDDGDQHNAEQFQRRFGNGADHANGKAD